MTVHDQFPALAGARAPGQTQIFQTACKSASKGARLGARSGTGARRRGAALIEFALVAPLLILLTLGMIQGGIILNARASLSNVAREVGRYAAVNGTAIGADNLIKDFAVQKGKDYNLTIRAADVIVGPPDENTATVSTNREQYKTQLPIKISSDISGRVFLPTTFFGAKMLPGGVVTVSTNVMCE